MLDTRYLPANRFESLLLGILGVLRTVVGMVPMVMVMLLLLTSITGIVPTATTTTTVAAAVDTGRMCRHRRAYMVLEGSGRCRRRCCCSRLTNLGHGTLVARRTHLIFLLDVPHARSMPKKVCCRTDER